MAIDTPTAHRAGAAKQSSRRAQGNLQIAIVIAATIILAVLVNVLLGGMRARVDLSANQVNVLSPASKEAVSALDELEVKLYISPEMPDKIPLGPGHDVKLQGVPQKLRDKIAEYQAYGTAMTVTEVTEDVVGEAEKNHLKPFTGSGGSLKDSGRFEFQKYVLGATFHYRDQIEVLELALEPQYFEFEITKRLIRLKDTDERAGSMKDILATTKSLGDAAQACTKALEAAAPSDKDDRNPLAMLSPEATQNKMAAFKTALPKVQEACAKVRDGVAQGKTLAKKNDAFDRMVLIADAFLQRLDQFAGALGQAGSDPQQPGGSGAVVAQHGELVQIGKALEGERGSVNDSPGRRRIGFICAGKTFCPFPEHKELIPKEIAGALVQKNQILQQMLPIIDQIQQQMAQIMAQVNQGLFKSRGFDIVKVDLDDEIPPDVHALVVYGPKGDFSDWQLYQLDQFVMGGGSLIAFLNPWDVNIQLYSPKGDIEKPSLKKNSSNLSNLLGNYGIKPSGAMLLDPQKHGLIALMQFLRQGERLIPFQSRGTEYPMIPTFEDFDASDPLVRSTTSLTLPFTTTLQLEPKPNLQVTALVTSSKNAVTMDDPNFPLDPGAQAEKIAGQTGQPHVVAAVAHGTFESAYKGKAAPTKLEASATGPDGKPEPKKPDVAATTVPRRDSGEGRVLVIGSNLGLQPLSNDVVFEGFTLQMVAGEGMDYIEKFRQYQANFQNWSTRINQVQHTLQENLQFMQNVLDWGVQRGGLAELRSKQDAARTLDLADDSSHGTYKAVAVIGLPAVFLIVSVILWAVFRGARRRRFAL